MARAHTCPICHLSGFDASERYPRALCPTCAARAVGADGRAVRVWRQGVPCQVDGRPCWAEPARFGGVVVQLRDGEASRDG